MVERGIASRIAAMRGMTRLGTARNGAAGRGKSQLGMVWHGKARIHQLEKTMMHQPEFRISADAAAIARSFEALQVGETLTYAAISTLVGRDARSIRGAIATALQTVQRDKRMVLGTVRKVGYIRLNDGEIIDTYDQTRARIRRQSARAVKRLVCVDYDALPKDKQVKHNAALSMLGVIAELSSVGSARKIENSIAESGTSLPAAKAAIAALGI